MSISFGQQLSQMPLLAFAFLFTAGIASVLLLALVRQSCRLRSLDVSSRTLVLQLKTTDAHLRSILDAIPDALLITNAFGTIIMANRQVEALLGYRGDELIGQTIENLMPEALRNDHQVMRLEYQAMPSVRPMNYGREINALHKDGRECEVEVRLSHVRTDYGVFVASALTNIDERKKSEQKIRHLLDEQRIIFDNAQVGILMIREGKIIKCNKFMADMFGYVSAKYIEGNTAEIFFCSRQEYRDTRIALCREMELRGAAQTELKMRCADGNDIWVILVGTPLSQTNVCESSIWVCADITQRKVTEDELRIAAAAFDSQEGMLITDATSTVLRVNRAFTRVTGYSSDEIVGKTPWLLKSNRHPPEFYKKMWDTVKENGSWQGEIWDRRKGGEDYPKWLTISAVRDKDGRITHYIGTHSDITERKKTEELIQDLAFRDQLTGLANRFSLHERLVQASCDAERNAGQLAVMMIDLDNFKTINDTLGHLTGDQLLVQVASRLSEAVRQSDLVARFGGDEFVIVLSNIDSPSDAAYVADKVLTALSLPYVIEERELRTSASIGICLYPVDATDGHELIKKADVAMYNAKSSGRGRYQFFTEEMHNETVRRLAMEADLRSALNLRQFVLHYQPQLDLRSGQIVGVEALIRWEHPERGLVPPIEFISIAEEIDLIVSIGDWVLEESCRQLAIWRTQGIEHIRVSVNLSARQFLDRALPDRICALLHQHGLDAGRLELEITESMSMNAPEETVASMLELRSRGLSLSIDDFGTGYSSLAYLKMFPINSLKIDRSFVKDIEVDQNDAEICGVTVSLAHKLGLNVVAEGVETEAQLKYLMSIGCEKIQGYLISKPLPSDQVGEFLRNTRLTGLAYLH